MFQRAVVQARFFSSPLYSRGRAGISRPSANMRPDALASMPGGGPFSKDLSHDQIV